MAMVEQRNSLPQAVPSSIYKKYVSQSEPSKVWIKDFFSGQSARKYVFSRLARTKPLHTMTKIVTVG
jgi:hypothetical protein